LRREQGIAVSSALAVLDPDQHALAVDIVDLEVGNLRDAQARAIGHAQRGLVLDPRRCLEQPGGLLDAQHLAHRVGAARGDEASDKIPPPQGNRVKEAQCRDRAVDDPGVGAALVPVV
jgi:hypothetical protein